MFESNAIQFGMDQMLEASSEQLSSFIHWYIILVCSHRTFGAILYCNGNVYFENCKFQMDHADKLSYTIFNFLVLII